MKRKALLFPSCADFSGVGVPLTDTGKLNQQENEQ